MTQTMIKWPSINQYREVVKNVQHKAAYIGLDENGDPKFDKTRKNPTLKFEGTVKLHGTNAAVGIDVNGNVWFQSRENIITPEHDNAGFAMFGTNNDDSFLNIADAVDNECNAHDSNNILIFGEWCGGSIQKSVALNELPKMFVIFGIAVVDSEGQKQYLTRQQIIDICDRCRSYVLRAPELKTGIYSIFDMPVYEMEIDFENPHESQNLLNELTLKVGDECPWAKQFGVSGIGEGIVHRCVTPGYEDSGYFFKVKDERHSNSKVKTLATVDVERINNIKELCETLAHNGRLSQGLDVVFGVGEDRNVDITMTGHFIQWVMKDIFKEEMSLIAESGFNGKEINGPVAKIARDFLLKSLEV